MFYTGGAVRAMHKHLVGQEEWRRTIFSETIVKNYLECLFGCCIVYKRCLTFYTLTIISFLQIEKKRAYKPGAGEENGQ